MAGSSEASSRLLQSVTWMLICGWLLAITAPAVVASPNMIQCVDTTQKTTMEWACQAQQMTASMCKNTCSDANFQYFSLECAQNSTGGDPVATCCCVGTYEAKPKGAEGYNEMFTTNCKGFGPLLLPQSLNIVTETDLPGCDAGPHGEFNFCNGECAGPSGSFYGPYVDPETGFFLGSKDRGALYSTSENECSPGQYFDNLASASRTCKPCPAGTFGDGTDDLLDDSLAYRASKCSGICDASTDQYSAEGASECTTCGNGYAWNGTACNDVNECENANGGCPDVCNNEQGSFSCECVNKVDWSANEDGTVCDPDECAVEGPGLGPCGLNAVCEDKEIGFECTCNTGFFPLSPTSCKNVNECDASPCDEDATCTDSEGSFSCSCNDGYQGTGLECENVNECDASPCDEDATCTDSEGSFSCSCNDGYQGTGLECDDVNECSNDDDNNCDVDATCTNEPGGYSCACNNGFGGDGFLCVPFVNNVPVEKGPSSLLIVESVEWNLGDACPGAPGGCWLIDVVHSDVNSVLFLSKSGESLPLVSEFPCGMGGYDPSDPSQKESACCIHDFISDYTLPVEFVEWYQEEDFSSCGSDTGSTVMEWMPGFYDDSGPGAFGEGVSFGSGNPLRRTNKGSFAAGEGVSFRGIEDLRRSGGKIRARITIWDSKLPDVSKTTPLEGGFRHELFVGLAEFVPTGTRILDSMAQQVSLTFSKTSFGVVSSHGTTDYSFVNFVNARANLVRNADNKFETPAYYATITVAIDEGFEAPDGKAVIPASSVLINSDYYQGDQGTPGCADDPQPAWMLELLAQSCGPDAGSSGMLCREQFLLPSSDRVATINIPLSSDVISEDEVAIELAVMVKDAEGKPLFTTVKMVLALTDGDGEERFVEWCSSMAPEEVELADEVDVTLMVGASDSSLSEVSSAPLNVGTMASNTYTTQSVQDGLFTLLVEYTGNNQADYKVTLQEVITLHIVEEEDEDEDGDEYLRRDIPSEGSLADQITSALDNDGFTVSWDSQGRGTLVPSTNLLQLCEQPDVPGQGPVSMGCAMRSDITDGAVNPTSGSAYELVTAANSDGSMAGDFFANISASFSPVVRDLGVAFEALIQSEKTLNDQTARAWWINGGFNWYAEPGVEMYTLSQEVIITALFVVETVPDNGTPTRRSIVRTVRRTEAADTSEVTNAAIKFNVAAETLTAEEEDLGLPLTVELGISRGLRCLPIRQLIQYANHELTKLLEADSSVDKVLVRGVSTDQSSCNGAVRRQLDSQPMHIDAVIVLTKSADAKASASNVHSRLAASPGVLSVQSTGSGSMVPPPAESPPNATGHDSESKSAGASPLLLALIAVACALVLAVALLMRKWRTKTQELPQPPLHAWMDASKNTISTQNAIVSNHVVCEVVCNDVVEGFQVKSQVVGLSPAADDSQVDSLRKEGARRRSSVVQVGDSRA